jgi:poly(A) polymerase
VRPLPEATRGLPEHPALTALHGFAAAEGVDLYLAGGAVRDLLLGRRLCDLDFASAADPKTFAHQFATQQRLPFVLLDDERGVARVVVPSDRGPGLDLDFSLFRAGGNIEADLLERDFTVNALALPFEALMAGRLDPIIDPTGGLRDLEARLLRQVLPRSLADDPLRALRLYRLAAQYGFAIEPATRRSAQAQAPNLRDVAGERVRSELVRLLEVPCAPELQEMAERGLLAAILPGLEAMRGVAQRGYHHLDVLGHALLSAERLEEVATSPEHLLPCPEELEPYLHEAPRWLLKLAALLHDAGKPETAEEGEGHVSFHRHEERGEELAKEVAERLRLSRAEAGRLQRLVALHMRPFHLVRLLRLGELTERAVRRMLDAAGEDFPGLMLLALADSLAAEGPDKPPDAEDLLAELFCRIMRYQREVLCPLRERPRLLTGDDLMAAFGLAPGPRIGELLEAVEDAYLEGEVSTREEALALAARLLKEE